LKAFCEQYETPKDSSTLATLAPTFASDNSSASVSIHKNLPPVNLRNLTLSLHHLLILIAAVMFATSPRSFKKTVHAEKVGVTIPNLVGVFSKVGFTHIAQSKHLNHR
jgi:hypothetical protein